MCRCLALIYLALIRLPLKCFAAFGRQLAVSPQGDRPSRCGGAHTQRGRIGSPARASNRRAAVSNLDRKTWNNSCGSIFCFCEQ